MSFVSELDSYIARFEGAPPEETEEHPVAAPPSAGTGVAARQGAELRGNRDASWGPGGFDVPFAASADQSRFSLQTAGTPSPGPTRTRESDSTRACDWSNGFEIRYLQPSPAQTELRHGAGDTARPASEGVGDGAHDTPERQPQPQPTLSALARGRTGCSPRGSPPSESSGPEQTIDAVPQEGPPQDPGASSRSSASDDHMALLEEHKSMLLSPFNPALVDQSRATAPSVDTPTPLREFQEEQSAHRRAMRAWLEDGQARPGQATEPGAPQAVAEQSPTAPLCEYVARADAQRTRVAQEAGLPAPSPAASVASSAPAISSARPAPEAESVPAESHTAPQHPAAVAPPGDTGPGAHATAAALPLASSAQPGDTGPGAHATAAALPLASSAQPGDTGPGAHATAAALPLASSAQPGDTGPGAHATAAAAAAATALPLLLSMLQQQQQQQQLQQGVTASETGAHSAPHPGVAVSRRPHPSGKPPLPLRRTKRSPHRADTRTASRLTTAKPPGPSHVPLPAPEGRTVPASPSRGCGADRARSGPSLRGGHARGAPAASAESHAHAAVLRRRRERPGAERAGHEAGPTPRAAATRSRQLDPHPEHPPRAVAAVRDASVETTPSLKGRHKPVCRGRTGGRSSVHEPGQALKCDASVATSPAAPPSSPRDASTDCAECSDGGPGREGPAGEDASAGGHGRNGLDAERPAPEDEAWDAARTQEGPSNAAPVRPPREDGNGEGTRGEEVSVSRSPLADLAHSMRFRLDDEQLRYLEAALRLLARAGVLHSAWGGGGEPDFPRKRQGGESVPASVWEVWEARKRQQPEPQPGPASEELPAGRSADSTAGHAWGSAAQPPEQPRSKHSLGEGGVRVAYSATSPAMQGQARVAAQSPATKAGAGRGMRYPSEERSKLSPGRESRSELASPDGEDGSGPSRRHVDLLAAKAAQALATPQSAPWFRDLLSSVTDSMRDEKGASGLSPPSADPEGRGEGAQSSSPLPQGGRDRDGRPAPAHATRRPGRDIGSALSAAYREGDLAIQGREAHLPGHGGSPGRRRKPAPPPPESTEGSPSAAPTAEELLAAVLQSPSESSPAHADPMAGTAAVTEAGRPGQAEERKKEEEEGEEEKEGTSRLPEPGSTPVAGGGGARVAPTPSPSQLEELLSRSFQMLASEKRKLGAAARSPAGPERNNTAAVDRGAGRDDDERPAAQRLPNAPPPVGTASGRLRPAAVAVEAVPSHEPRSEEVEGGVSAPAGTGAEAELLVAGATPRDAAPVRRALQFTPTLGAKPSPRPTPEEVSLSPSGARSAPGVTAANAPFGAPSLESPCGGGGKGGEVSPSQGPGAAAPSSSLRPPSPSPFAAYAPSSRGGADSGDRASHSGPRTRAKGGRPPSGRRGVRERRASPVASRLLQPTASSAAKRRAGLKRGARRGAPGTARGGAPAVCPGYEDGRPGPEARGVGESPSGEGSAGGGVEGARSTEAGRDCGERGRESAHDAASSWGVPALSASPAPSTGFPTARDEAPMRSSHGCDGGEEEAPCPPLPAHDRFVLVVSDPCVPLRPLCGALEGCALDALLVSSPVDVVQLLEEGKAAAGKPIVPRAVLVDTALSPTTVFRCAAAVRSAAAGARPPLIAVHRRRDWLTALAGVPHEELAQGAVPNGVSPLVARIAASKGIDAAREQRQRAIEAAGFAASLDEAADVEACLAALERVGVDLT